MRAYALYLYSSISLIPLGTGNSGGPGGFVGDETCCVYGVCIVVGGLHYVYGLKV